MEVIKVVGKDSQGFLQRVLVELGRRKIEVEKAFMARSGQLQTIIIEANTGNMNGRLLHALMALQDVNTAEYITEDYFCFWESSPGKRSDYLIACGTTDQATDDVKKAAEHCLYKNNGKGANK